MNSLISSLLPSLIGLGAKVGTAVPGMRKAPKQNTAREVAKTAGAQFGKAVGAAQAGHGASRGLALREGLRRGTEAVGQVSAQVGRAAAVDQATNTQNEIARRERIASFGSDLAKGIGDMAAMGIAPKKATPGQKQEALDTVAEQPELGSDPTGLAGPGAGVPSIEQQQAVDQQAFIDDAATRLEDFKLQREEAGIPGPEEMTKAPTAQLIEEAYQQAPQVAAEVERELDQRHSMKSLMLSEVERLGLSLETMVPRINRRLGLNPGEVV